MNPHDILTRLTSAAAAKAGVAAYPDDPNAPDLDELIEASQDVEGGDGPDVEPQFVGARPLLDDTIEPVELHGARMRSLGSPVPAASNAFDVVPDNGGAGLPVLAVPASGGRARRVTIRNISGSSQAVKLYVERAGSAAASTPPPGGFTLPDGGEHVTTTQGPVFAAADGAWRVCVWVDTYGEPSDHAPRGQ